MRHGLYYSLARSTKTKFLFAVMLLSVPASLAFATSQSGSAGQAMDLHHDDVAQPLSPQDHTSAAASDNSGTSSTVTLHATSRSSTSANSAESSSTATDGPSAQQSSNVQLEVNGQHINVPANGSVHHTFSSGSGQSTIDISVDNQQSSSTSSSNQMTFDIQQQSDSSDVNEP